MNLSKSNFKPLSKEPIFLKPGVKYQELPSSNGQQNGLDPNQKIENLLIVKPENRKQVEFNSQESTYKGTVGQLSINFDGKIYVGTGSLISYKGRYLMLTCAHNFYMKVQCVKEDGIAQIEKRIDGATFHYQNDKSKTNNLFSVINESEVVPGYLNESILTNIFSGNDLAVGLLGKEQVYKDKAFQSDCTWSFMEHIQPKVGEKIVIIGYPGDQDGQCFEQEGTIETIQEGIHDEDKAIITYTDIDTTYGQSGSPIFLKRGDNYFLIGVHSGGEDVENSQKQKIKVGNLITLEVYKWIIQQFETLR